IAGDPVLYGNLPPREISMKDVFRSGDSSKKFKIAEGQWYRYAPSYVSPAYHLLEDIAAVIAYYVHPVNIQTACLIMEGAEFTENIINGVERPVKAAELFAFTLRVRAGNTDVLTD